MVSPNLEEIRSHFSHSSTTISLTFSFCAYLFISLAFPLFDSAHTQAQTPIRTRFRFDCGIYLTFYAVFTK